MEKQNDSAIRKVAALPRQMMGRIFLYIPPQFKPKDLKS
jgi:hypothetical protein